MNSGFQTKIRPSLGLLKNRARVNKLNFVSAINFDGINDNATVIMGNGVGEFPTTLPNIWSISLWWQNLDATPAGNNGVYIWGNPSGTGPGFNALTWQSTGWALRSPNAQLLIRTTAAVGEWNHTISVYNTLNNKVKIYNNGSYLGEQDYISPVGNTFKLGEWINKFQGKISEVAVWQTGLNSKQVTQLYNLGFGKDARTIYPNELIAYWKITETSGTTAFDSSGNGRNLTLNNGASFVPF